MKKNKIVMLIVAIVFGLIIGVQIRTISKNMSVKTEEGTLRTRELAEEIKTLDDERERQKHVIEELNNKLLKYENENKDVDDITRELYDELSKIKTIACLTDVIGEGIELKITPPNIKTDSNNYDTITENPEILLRIVSTLNSADAEAISINEQRISSYTEIEKAGNNININGVAISFPLIIKTIGDSKTLISALNIKNGILDELRAYNYTAIVAEKDSIMVEKLHKEPQLRYTKIVDK